MEVGARIVVIDGETQILSVARDITARKEAERRMAHLQRVLRTIARADRVLLRENDSGRLIDEVATVLEAEGGYDRVWITLRGPDGELAGDAHAGIGEEYDEFRERLTGGWVPPCVKRLTSDAEPVSVVTDRQTVCAACPLRDACGSGVPVVAVLAHGERRFGHMVAALDDDETTRSEQVELLRGFAENLSYALARTA